MVSAFIRIALADIKIGGAKPIWGAAALSWFVTDELTNA